MGLVLKLIGCVWGYMWGGATALVIRVLVLPLTVSLREDERKTPLVPWTLQVAWVLS